jgi:hypothetical protein
MNPRLIAYLRSLGLAQDANDQTAWEFFQGLRGISRTIANCLNYAEADAQARTNCDLAIRSLGYDPADPTQLLEPERSEPTETPAPAPQTDDAVRAERERVARIVNLGEVANAPESLRQQAINEGWTVERTQDAFLAHVRGQRQVVPASAPAGHVRNSDLRIETLEAAVLHRNSIDPSRDWVRNEGGTPTRVRITPELERAMDEGYRLRRASLEDIVRMCAQIDGVRLGVGRLNLMREYLQQLDQRQFSTSALAAVFTTNVNSMLLAAYETAPDSTGGWCREADVADFRNNERVRMLNGGALQKLPRGSEAEHTEYEDAVESYKIARYASQFEIDEQDLIDDNFGGLSGFVPSDMGVAARQLRPDLVYGTLMANAAMRDSTALFHANHGNLSTTAALADSTLKAAIAAMMKQTEGGRNLNLTPRYLIVPVALKWSAMELLNSAAVVIAGTAGSVTRASSYNSLAQEGLTIVSDSRLDNGVTHPATGTAHAGSNSTWFLACAPSAHTIEVGYLRGSGRVPQVRSSVLSQGRWGINFDVKMDIGAKALDWKGLHKATA